MEQSLPSGFSCCLFIPQSRLPGLHPANELPDAGQALLRSPGIGTETLHGADSVTGTVDDVLNETFVLHGDSGPVEQFEGRAAQHPGLDAPHASGRHQRRGALPDDLVGDEASAQQRGLLVQQLP